MSLIPNLPTDDDTKVKLTYEERCAIMEPAMKQAVEILVNAHDACGFEGGDGNGICVVRPETSNGNKYFLKFCRLEDATLKDIKGANKLEKPTQLRSVPMPALNNNLQE